MRQEGPISLEHLARRVAAHWDVSRRSSKIVKRIEAWATFEGVQKVIHDDRIFYWPDRQDPAGYRAFRIAGESEETCRKADDLPPEEVANAAHHVLKQAVSLPATGLVRDAARLMGFLRTGAAVSG
ncbi:MAG: DUF3320 domain-containing protein [bacterium]|nr:DUF3320 domain-containing protein [bacterium]